MDWRRHRGFGIQKPGSRGLAGLLGITGLALGPAGLVAGGAGGGAAQMARFRFEDVSGRSVKLWDGAKPVLVYNHGPIGNAGVAGAVERACYVHPLFGLDGEVLTDDFPADHLYHRGLYWAWPHVRVGDREHDLWSLRGIRQEHVRWISRECLPGRALLAAENAWKADGRTILREEIRIIARGESAGGRAIDLDLTLTPVERAVTLQGAQGKSYGGLSLRFGPRAKTLITTPDGRTPDDLLVHPLPWADLSGDLAQGRMSGAAVLVHPSHPGFPPTWMTRHYGLLAVGWPGVAARTLAPGVPVALRYRVWVHRGNPDAAEIGRMWEEYGRE